MTLFQLDTSSPLHAPGWAVPPQSPALLLIANADGHCQLLECGRKLLSWASPLAALNWLETDIRARPASARWIGYLGYDLGGFFERLPAKAFNDLRVPLFVFGLCHVDAAPITPGPHAVHAVPSSALDSTFTQAGYQTAISQVINYIRAGDIFQANISQRLKVSTLLSDTDIHAALRIAAPARFAALLRLPDFALVSNSPELFFRLDADRRVTMRPIKGTRPALAGMEAELQDSSKDKAELAMIVDLIRNDLGRVCEIGSVRVPEPRIIEAHPNIVHGVATITGRLRPDVTLTDLLAATFPSGSVTGAPKIRAMQIIDEIEPVRRGAYCGAIGYLAPDGSAQFNVAIRTITLKNGTAYVPVGGGIVADSVPAEEYAETLTKAGSMLRALGVLRQDGIAR